MTPNVYDRPELCDCMETDFVQSIFPSKKYNFDYDSESQIDEDMIVKTVDRGDEVSSRINFLVYWTICVMHLNFLEKKTEKIWFKTKHEHLDASNLAYC